MNSNRNSSLSNNVCIGWCLKFVGGCEVSDFSFLFRAISAWLCLGRDNLL
jgi:hypothetical protein